MGPYSLDSCSKPVPSPRNFYRIILSPFSRSLICFGRWQFSFGGIPPGVENSLSETYSDMHDNEVCYGVAPEPWKSRGFVFFFGWGLWVRISPTRLLEQARKCTLC
jgi:hypothetical protein